MADQESLRKAIEGLGPGFELIRELGRGATAIVYLVRDHELERDLAVKVIRSSFAHDEEAVARLQREARLVAQLQHPNIVRVFSTTHLMDGSLALLMEHVPGRNLKEVLRATGPFTPRQATAILRDVASALAYAHRRRIVHRDVKPENIYLDEEVGTARLADFGIARPWDRDARLTVPGEALGTPAYMSPEQIDGEEVDGRTDVYSLGLVGYEMLAGEHPWESDNLFNIIFKQKNERLPPLGAARPDAPAELIRTLEKAIEKSRERRWESADALLEQLDELHPDDGGDAETRRPRTATRVAPPEVRPAPRRRAWRKKRLALAALLVVAVGVGAWGWSRWRGQGSEGWVSLSEDAVATPAASAPGNPSASTGPAAVASSSALEPIGDRAPSALVGASVPLTVRVPPDSTGSAAQVVFRVIEGQGVLDAELVDVDGSGDASVNLRLPPRPGTTVVLASVQGREDEPLRFDVTANVGAPQEVVAIVGNGQEAEPGSPLPQAVGVRVVDEQGNPVPDTEVRFQVLVGDGSVTPARVRTDTLGRAFARWRLGGSTGEQRAAALVPSAEEATVVFQATARAAATAVPPTTRPSEASAARDPAAGRPAVEAPGAQPPRIVQQLVAVGGTHVCRVGNRGFAECQGARDRGQAGGASEVQVRFVSLAAGVSHSCGLDATGRAYCWGANDGGQLGIGSRADRPTSTPVETPVVFGSLALGLAHSCGLDGAGRALCWGRNVNGQLGDGTRDDRTAPVVADAPGALTSLAAGWNHTCAIAAGSGRALCWGLNAEGQLGDGTRIDRVVPTPVAASTSFGSLTAGNAHTCGLSSGIVYCWGANGSGQLGIGRSGSQLEPVRLEGLPSSVTQVVAGAVHTCALLRDGQAWCWGQNTYGQLGDGSTSERTLPTTVTGEIRFRTLEAGGGSTCGLAMDGALYCWGFNQSGQLGDGTRTNRATPTRAGE